MSKTNPAFTDNFVAAPSGIIPDVGIRQGQDIVIKNSYGADYMFYGLLEKIDDVTGNLTILSVTWDGFNDGVKDGILIIHTQKSITGTDPKTGKKHQIDVALPTGHYRLVLRDDPTPSGLILGETVDFSLFA